MTFAQLGTSFTRQTSTTGSSLVGYEDGGAALPIIECSASSTASRRRHETLSVSVRTAIEADLERITEIKVRNWADTYSPLVEPDVLAPFLDYRRQLAAMRKVAAGPDTLLLVAEADPGGVGAFALAYPDHETEGWLESLHVLRELRSHGVGTLLMRATAAALRARGYRSLRLGVVSGNAAAARFYERLGATFAGREPTSWAEGVWHEIYRWADLETLV